MQIAALPYGVVFLPVGAAGFIPGITTNCDQLMVAGPESEVIRTGLLTSRSEEVRSTAVTSRGTRHRSASTHSIQEAT